MRRHSTPLQKEEVSFTARNMHQSRLIPTSPVDTRPESSLEVVAKLQGSQILRAKQERRLRAERKIRSPTESRSQLGTRRESMDENIPAGDTGNYSLQINKRSASVSQALKKIDFRLKTNVDLEAAPHAQCVIRNDSRVCYPADLKLAFHDYDISEGDMANKTNFMKIPQKPVVLYDPLLDVKRVVKPPDMEIPAFDKYKQNVAKLMSVPRAFNKKQGTFQFELNERLKDGVFRKSMRQSYEDQQIMKRLLNSIASNMPLKKKKKSSMLLRLGKRSIDNSSQVVVPPEEANMYSSSPYQQYIPSPLNQTPKPPKSSMSPYNRTQNMFTPYQQMANTQDLRKSIGKNGSQHHGPSHTQNHSHDVTYQRSHTEMSNYGHIPSRSNLYGASHFAKHKASGSIISGTSFTDGNTRPTVRRNTSIATATTAYTMRSGQDGLSPKEQEALKMQSVQLGLIQPYHGLNNMKAILNRSAMNSPKRRTRQVDVIISNVFSPVKRKKEKGEESQNLTMDGRENPVLLQDGGLSTVIGNTFYGKIEEFERKQSADGTPAFKRFSIPRGREE